MIYVDTSALVQLVVREAGSDAVDRFLADADMVSSTLLGVEARRGTLRRAPAMLPREAASRLPDPLLRSLDAIHLATALQIRSDIEAVLTYDERFAAAAVAHGLGVAAPV